MAVAFVQLSNEITVVASTGGSVTLNGVGAGNLLVAAVISPDSDGARQFTITDDKNAGNWSTAVQLAGVTPQASLLYRKNTS